MELSLLVLLLCMFATFVAVGVTFFTKGTHTFGWYLTLAPFVIMAGLLVFFYLGRLPAIMPSDTVLFRAASAVATVFGCSALLLFGGTLCSHRGRIPMWHQHEEKPEEIVTSGTYRYIRHPFYASYYLYMTACMLAAPSYVVLATAAYCLIALNVTAAREERELLLAFGSRYANFKQRTGRFWPRFHRRFEA